MKAPVGLTTLLAGALAVAALAGCSDRAAGTPGVAVPAVPVTVGEVVRRPVPLQVVAVGNAQSITSVGVKSQVAGQILNVHFSEGQEVRKGDLLFTIDPRPFQAALSQAQATAGQRQAEVLQAEANLARDLAQLENARVQERRYRELVEKDLVAREQYDQLRTNASALEATVRADRAAVENTGAALKAAEAAVDTAKLQLAYTTIRAPMDGRTGNRLGQAGNIVQGNDDNPLVVINQIRPIYVSFAVPDHYLDSVRRYREAGMLRVEVKPPKAAEPIGRGEVTFVNNTVDMATGTIQLKATFPNTDNALWPGQFLDVILTLTTENAVVVPSQAIQPGQKGPFVFVVKADNTVEARPIEVGRRLERETIVNSGLSAGERVVTDGQLRLVPGAKIDIKPPRAT